MSDKFLSEKIKKVSPSEVSPDRYSYFKPGEVEPDLGVPLVDNGISTSLSDGTREWSYLSSGLDIANNNITVDVNTVEIDSENLNYADSNTLFQAITEIDQNVYDDVQRRLIIVSTDATLTGDGTANNVLGVNANNILEIIGESVTQEYINNLDIDAATLEGANGSFYLDWDNTTNKPSPTIEISLTGDVTGYANTTLTELANGVITIDTTVSANSVELGVDTYGDYVQSIEAGTGVYISGNYGESAVLTISIGQDVSPVSNVTFNNAEFTGDVTIDGNLTISGNAVSIQATTLSITDNMIYLNANSTITNPDIGFAANYNDGTYAHTGLFRDASDGIYKFFDSYTPEPNINPYINTGDASFRLAEVSARRFYGPLTGDVTGQVSSIGNFSTSNLVEGSRLYYTVARANTAIDARVTKTFIDNLNVDADTFDNQDSTYYLNYNNLTNKPVIGDGLLTISTADGLSGSATFTANQVGPSNLSLTNTDRGSSQSIFKTILVSGQPTIVAATNNDSLEFVAGSNVSLTTDATTKKIVINSTAASEDNYVDSISFDEVTGSLTLGRTGTLPDLVVTIAALSANSTVEYTYNLTGADAPEGAYINLIGSDSTTDTIYLKEAGATTISWNDVSQTVTISSVDTTYQAGNGLNLTGTTFSHADTSSASNISAVTGTFVSSLTFDTYGHVTGYTTAAETDNYVDSITFNANTAMLTLGRTGTLPDISVELFGLIGPTGFTGSQGDIGFTGSQGDAGFVGSQGDIGFTGSRGFMGSQGDTGFTGSGGNSGFTGSFGDTGFTGSRGDTGFTGSRGDTGFTGSFGDTGFTGSRGDTGFTGSFGDTGFTGSTGMSTFLAWSAKSSNYTASISEGIITNTSGGSFTVTLPASPTVGNIVVLADGYDWGIAPLTVGRNGSTIEGLTDNFVLDVSQARVDFIYSGTTWQVYANVGPVGFTGSVGFVGSKGDVGFVGSKGLDGFNGFLQWSSRTSNYTATTLEGIIANTTGGSFTVTLPASPTVGHIVVIADGGDWGINPLTVARNGSTIENLADSFVLDISQTRVDFIYSGTTWQVYSNTGPIGFTGSRGFMGSQGATGPAGATGPSASFEQIFLFMGA